MSAAEPQALGGGNACVHRGGYERSNGAREVRRGEERGLSGRKHRFLRYRRGLPRDHCALCLRWRAPSGGQAKLDYFVGKEATWWAIVGLSVLTNFLYVPVSVALYFALRKINEAATLVGISFVGLFIALENAVNWTAYGALIILSGTYAAATTEPQRLAIAAAATYGASVLDSPLAAVWAIGTLSLAFLILGVVMLKGVFNKATAYVGILTGLLGLAAVAGVDVAVILNATFALVWIALVGYRFYRLAR